MERLKQLPYGLDLITPKVPAPASDKFSRNIANWLRRNRIRQGAGVFCSERSWLDGSRIPFTHHDAARSDIYIGQMDEEGWVYGAGVRAIQIKDFQVFAHPPRKWPAVDITDWFWAEYLKRGRCLMESTHDVGVQYDEARFAVVGEGHRRCNWCGLNQVLKTAERVVTEQRWEPTPTP
jgi:hypothetical protein